LQADRRIGHAHHLAGDAIGFLFILIIGGPNGQLALHADGGFVRNETFFLNQPRDVAVTQRSLQLEERRVESTAYTSGGIQPWSRYSRHESECMNSTTSDTTLSSAFASPTSRTMKRLIFCRSRSCCSVLES